MLTLDGVSIGDSTHIIAALERELGSSDCEVPAAPQEFLDSLAARPGGRWVATMYERHRAVD